MKKLAIFAKTLLIAAVAGSIASCGNNTDAEGTAATATGDSTTQKALPNIRFIDGDSVSAHYNLAKDFQDASLRAFQRIDNARQSRAREIQNFAASVESKARNNGYLTQESYNADMAKLQKMQQDAEQALAAMQRSTEQELAQQQMQLNDSVEAFIKAYNAKKGYDAILFKAAGVYFNPSLDITKEVIEGLNARYNKVSDKN